jgi:hypothetical protein
MEGYFRFLGFGTSDLLTLKRCTHGIGRHMESTCEEHDVCLRQRALLFLDVFLKDIVILQTKAPLPDRIPG